MPEPRYLNYVDARVWWIPQVPMQPFHIPVSTLEEAILILDTLAKYDIFQFKNNIKPDYCNAGGLEVLDEDEGWSEYEDNEGRDIDDIIEEKKRVDNSWLI